MTKQKELIKQNRVEHEKDDSFAWFSPIPYVKEFKRLDFVKSTNACLLMAKLEIDFNSKPKGFYRYITPNPYQKESGQLSWCEILGINSKAFISAFDQIGTRYKSRKEFLKTEDKFKGKCYCSVIDSLDKQKTYYFRNDEFLESRLEWLADELQAEGFFEDFMK